VLMDRSKAADLVATHHSNTQSKVMTTSPLPHGGRAFIAENAEELPTERRLDVVTLGRIAKCQKKTPFLRVFPENHAKKMMRRCPKARES
jgi:hypothetical protein